MIVRLLSLLLLTAWLPGLGWAQDDSEPDKPPLTIVTPRKSDDAKTDPPQPVQGPKPPESAPEEQPDASEPGAPSTDFPRGRALFMGGIGAGAIFWFLDDDENPDLDWNPTFVLEGRWITLLSPHGGIEFLGRMEMHDWALLECAGAWIFDDSQDAADTARIILSPILLLVPIVASNIEFGIGGIFYSSTTTPNVYVDFGALFSILMRFTDPDFIMDFGMGAYLGFGFEITDHVGFSFRGNYQSPVFNSMLDDNAQHILSANANFTLSY